MRDEAELRQEAKEAVGVEVEPIRYLGEDNAEIWTDLPIGQLPDAWGVYWRRKDGTALHVHDYGPKGKLQALGLADELKKMISPRRNSPRGVKSFLIIGRVPDGENSLYLVKAKSDEEAVQKFAEQLWEGDPEGRDQAFKEHGSSFFQDIVLELGKGSTLYYHPNLGRLDDPQILT